MIYISIPVHEKPEVVVNQMQNFARYLPEAKVVLHVSKDAKFSVNELEDVLKKANVSHALVNPTQVETKWGSIIQAHLANIHYIIQQGDAEKIIFHSSNDMLIMDGLSEYLKDKKNIFHLRKCRSDSLWWVSRKAVKDSALSTFFNGKLYASQIEGSMYDISLLKSLVHSINNKDLVLNSELFYPLVYSEVHKFDRFFFHYIKKYYFFPKVNLFLDKTLKKILEGFLKIFLSYKININTINLILTRDNELSEQAYLDDGKYLSWKIYDINSIYAVKRVNRNMNDSVRLFINKL